jgi:ribosomal protein L27
MKPGFNVGCGRDHTLYALKNGNVHFTNTGFVSIEERVEEKLE